MIIIESAVHSNEEEEYEVRGGNGNKIDEWKEENNSLLPKYQCLANEFCNLVFNMLEAQLMEWLKQIEYETWFRTQACWAMKEDFWY